MVVRVIVWINFLCLIGFSLSLAVILAICFFYLDEQSIDVSNFKSKYGS